MESLLLISHLAVILYSKDFESEKKEQQKANQNHKKTTQNKNKNKQRNMLPTNSEY